MQERTSSKILNGLVIMGIILTILALIGTPLVLTAFLKSSSIKLSTPNIKWILTVCIYLYAVPYVATLFKLKKFIDCLHVKIHFHQLYQKSFK